MIDTPVRTQKRRLLKRALLSPVQPLIQPWVLRSSSSSRVKSLALKRLIVPKLFADGRDFEAKMPEGWVFRGNTSDLLALYVYLFKIWEPNLTAFIRHRMYPGAMFIDVGANVGWFSLLASAMVGVSGKVIAIEASPLLSDRLIGNVEANRFGNVQVINAAAGRMASTVDIAHGPAEHLGISRVIPGGPIPCDTLPNLVGEETLAQARVIKVDVEGAEYDVVDGLSTVLDRLTATELVVEVGPQRAKKPSDVEGLFAKFAEAHFHPYRLPNDYSPESYLRKPVDDSLARLTELPSAETDVVFSRTDSDRLPLAS